MFHTRRRQRALAAIAATLLLALAGLSAWFGDGDDEIDSLVAAGIVDVDDEDASDGVGGGRHSLRRSLLNVVGRWRPRIGAHPAFRESFIQNRVRLESDPDGNPCPGVLLTSMGGVGSSTFLRAIEAVQMHGGASFFTNDDQDADGFKHRPASWWADQQDGGRDASGLRGPDRDGNGHCFGKALVIVGDPVHTVESVVRRFHMGHINKLREGSGLWPPYRNSLPVERLYDDIAVKGMDTTGISQYITGWYAASQDRARWPDVRIVTAKTLFNNAEEHARWMGVEEKDLFLFKTMAFREGKLHKTVMSTSSDATEERVREVLAEATQIVEEVDNLSYDEGGEAPPEEEEEGPPPPAMDRRARRRAQRARHNRRNRA